MANVLETLLFTLHLTEDADPRKLLEDQLAIEFANHDVKVESDKNLAGVNYGYNGIINEIPVFSTPDGVFDYDWTDRKIKCGLPLAISDSRLIDLYGTTNLDEKIDSKDILNSIVTNYAKSVHTGKTFAAGMLRQYKSRLSNLHKELDSTVSRLHYLQSVFVDDAENINEALQSNLDNIAIRFENFSHKVLEAFAELNTIVVKINGAYYIQRANADVVRKLNQWVIDYSARRLSLQTAMKNGHLGYNSMFVNRCLEDCAELIKALINIYKNIGANAIKLMSMFDITFPSTLAGIRQTIYGSNFLNSIMLLAIFETEMCLRSKGKYREKILANVEFLPYRELKQHLEKKFKNIQVAKSVKQLIPPDNAYTENICNIAVELEAVTKLATSSTDKLRAVQSSDKSDLDKADACRVILLDYNRRLKKLLSKRNNISV